MIVAITGSIACGKSLVSSYLTDKGFLVVDADKIGHKLIDSNDIKNKLVKIFGEEILTNNNIDRKKLGDIVFKNKEELEILNSILHPKIKEEILINLNIKTGIRFVDIALLYEANFVDLVDKVIVVDVDKEVQLQRLIARNNFTREEAIIRIDSQISSSEKAKRADYVINNNGFKENTYKQIDEILKILMEGF